MLKKILSTVAVAIGSNLGDCHHYLLSAQQELLKIPQSYDFLFSSIYCTVSISETKAPAYLNAVAIFKTLLDPYSLLAELQKIENINHRTRSYINAPRTLDLDLLFYESLIMDDPKLTIPHPRIPERFFVLTPLAEVAPSYLHPIFNETIAELERKLIAQSPKNALISKSDKKFRSHAEKIV